MSESPAPSEATTTPPAPADGPESAPAAPAPARAFRRPTRAIFTQTDLKAFRESQVGNCDERMYCLRRGLMCEGSRPGYRRGGF
jgi:hypothetical protein